MQLNTHNSEHTLIKLAIQACCDEANARLETVGTAAEEFGVSYSENEEGYFSITWHYPRETEEGVMTDLTDQFDENNDLILEHRLHQLDALVSEDQTAVFTIFEPQFAAFRRLQYIQTEYSRMTKIFSLDVVREEEA
jgi:hypothetical protein